MLVAGAFRWHWLSKVGEELADLWVLKLEQWYICRQEGLNQLTFKFFLQNWNEGFATVSQLYLVVESSFLCFADDSEVFLAVNCLTRENAKQVSVGFARNSFGNPLSYCSGLLFARTGTFGILSI